MKCLRCSAELPAQSQFCLRCGTPVQSAPSSFQPSGSLSPTGQTAFPTAASNNRAIVAIIVVLGLLVLGLGSFVLAGVLAQKPDRASSNSIVQAPVQAGNNGLVQAPQQAGNNGLVQAPNDSQAPPIVQNPAPTAPSTADIEDYLRFLKDVEERKISLLNKQTADIMMLQGQQLGMQADAATNDDQHYLEDIRKQLSDMQKPWDDLAAYFNNRTPPASCRDLHDKYYDQLGKVEGMIMQIPTAISKANSGDPSAALQALQNMKGSSSNDADGAARLADNALADVCDRYHLHKEFSVRLP
ncbi:MAG TPA: zinc ribbon domain-containing protein [Chthonomonadaceae bacterium]|nr:zinc ribbon domain-containing protein [Chthonomonadaceae bacterium]